MRTSMRRTTDSRRWRAHTPDARVFPAEPTRPSRPDRLPSRSVALQVEDDHRRAQRANDARVQLQDLNVLYRLGGNVEPSRGAQLLESAELEHALVGQRGLGLREL